MPAPLQRVLPFILSLLVVYAGLCLLVYLTQDRLIYFPGPPPSRTPADFGIEFEPLQITTSDGVAIDAWLLPGSDSKGALIFCHGNAGTIEGRIGAARIMRDMGRDVLLFDYRGYGASEGRPDEEGTYRDAVAAYDRLLELGHRPEGIAVYGGALG